ncbi:glycerophosphodiester phosphodiesterase family protein [Nakamurella endophytica]|uniref:Glycerophosphoryl diester phosphodiesterase n=1 Tax=Nakamurella endophytica TaxID=1748367 RepID=A0A917SQQ3_9ACTN|nr:glycerophosphodiester phosphodiesterase family protein [Nakamurella endophytica]GGL91547.1 glycerophosphoryl diester phosphodiesterase [Nakamurella endophytica]
MTSFLDGPRPRAFAHRGWHTGDLAGCENTLAAFRRAVQEGFRYLETDVHVTLDGQLLAVHDSSLDRVTDLSGRVAELPWTRVRQARIGGRERIPLFDELLDLLRDHPDVRLNVDPKADAAVDPLARALADAGLVDRVCVGSFSDRRLRAVRAAAGPRLAVSLGPRAVARLVLAGRTRTRIRVPGAVAAQVPVRYGRVPVVTPGLLRAARRSGLEVHVWTVDDADDMRRLLDMGVDGLMTDRPAVLRSVLQQRGAW